MMSSNRRNFLKLSGLSILPAIAPVSGLLANETIPDPQANEPVIKFFADGELPDPVSYVDILKQINNKAAIEKDRYGEGGVVSALEKKFEAITGKEKAMFMLSGTMANQFAISVLSGDNTKVFVQDTSHVHRDEADAAQSVFQKRLMPLAKGETFFTAAVLKQAVESLGDEEVFKSGVGAVSIENPVRRTDGRMIPIEEIRKISAYCRANNIKLHLDGARIYMAAAWSGIAVKEYASYFDTIYISLYKYLGASGGAILCGDKTVMEKMPHLIKIHGGSMYGNWTNAAIALHNLDGLEEKLKNVIKRSTELFTALNKLPQIKVNALDAGTNIYQLQLSKEVNGKKMQTTLRETYNIRMGMPDNDNRILITVNETLLYRDTDYVVDAFKKSI